MRFPIFQIDAFTDRPFAGNPAAVVVLDRWLQDDLLQAIAMENNLAETAFLVKRDEDWHIRWFTPELEMDLCGHATLASAWVIFHELEHGAHPNSPSKSSMTLTEPQQAKTRFCLLRRALACPVRHPWRTRPTCFPLSMQASWFHTLAFHSRSGLLRVERDGDLLVLDFPSRPPQPCEAPAGLWAALGIAPRPLAKARDHFVVLDAEEDVASLSPDFQALDQVDTCGVIVTAPGREVDFVSRFFTPKAGIPEDPVTGSAHCTLIPYWAERLGKQRMIARQLSKRGGELRCEHAGERVHIGGHAIKVMEGTLILPKKR